MQTTWQALIDRAKTYVDDDNRAESGWITAERWLTLANVEYAQLYRRWMRSGLISPAVTTRYMDGPTTTFTGVLALVGVGKDLGDTVQPLYPAQTSQGRDAFWRGSTAPTGCSTSYAATGTSDAITIELDPVPNDLTGTNYIVRYVPTVAYATDPDASVDLPDGGDERLVLGMARRALLKDSGASSLLNQLIMDADAELNFTAAGKLGGPRVRAPLPRSMRSSTLRSPVWPPPRSQWLYL